MGFQIKNGMESGNSESGKWLCWIWIRKVGILDLESGHSASGSGRACWIQIKKLGRSGKWAFTIRKMGILDPDKTSGDSEFRSGKWVIWIRKGAFCIWISILDPDQESGHSGSKEGGEIRKVGDLDQESGHAASGSAFWIQIKKMGTLDQENGFSGSTSRKW